MINILILLPFIAGLLVFAIPKSIRKTSGFLALLVTLVDLYFTIILFKTNIMSSVPWAGFGIEFSLRLDHFSSFIILAVASFCVLVTLYSITFMKDKDNSSQFFAYMLISLAMTNGAVLANNLVVMLFFWEGLLVTLFAMILIGSKAAFKTAVKALVLVGISDLCLMIGIGLTGHLSGTLTMSSIKLNLDSLGGLAFIFLMIGAISKAGSMPFHSWIPDAAVDAHLPFMALLPAALEKLLGIYFLARISLEMFNLTPSSWISVLLMVIGGITILFAVMMALIQKDYKRLLSYHAISQVGYMILGIGTAVPVGIVGGLFHMINHAMYKSCLFLTGGSVERQAGTTDLKKLGGLGSKMPITFACFIVAAAAISGVPPFNGFFSKELIYDGALERGLIFYIMAVAGSFFTAASFLKLGHSVYAGKIKDENKNVKEAPLTMLIPMIVIACVCILFGVYNSLPLKHLIQPILGERLEGHSFSGWPANMTIVVVTVIVLIAALLNHLFGVKKSGSGLGSVDHIHYAPGLSYIYAQAEKRYFDPYDIGLKIVGFLSIILFGLDRIINWFYDVFVVKLTYFFTGVIKALHNGDYAMYLSWSLIGTIIIIIYIVMR
ncbi:MAG: proton-conducting transporter membrane subunit [Elusimicrobia bacterium]|nr:proton-conducting transporter membrane subunit [Elusimicrobiota bacterium]